MAAPFGFSVGDFLAALELVGKVIDALQNSGETSREYRELLQQLISLENALLHVKRLGAEASQESDFIALQQAATRCHETIDAFWEKINKYEPHRWCQGVHTRRLKDRWRKVKWSVCRKDDIAKFKADLTGHTTAIQLLLSTVQMRLLECQRKRQDEISQSLMSQSQLLSFEVMPALSVVAEGVKQSLQTMARIFATVLQIQRDMEQIPPQVQRQQPVFLLDACGRSAPFHLEFISSAEALIAVLAIKFERFGAGEAVRRRDFALEYTGTKRDIDLRRDWELCFTPGQRVEMSMIFRGAPLETTTCPRCRSFCEAGLDLDIEW